MLVRERADLADLGALALRNDRLGVRLHPAPGEPAAAPHRAGRGRPDALERRDDRLTA